MDYQGNSKSAKAGKDVPEKKEVEKVVSGEVIVMKKPLGRRIKDTFIEADFKSVVRYVMSEVFLPAARNMIVDGASKGVERMMYGTSTVHRRPGGTAGRVTYTNYGGSPLRSTGYRNAPPPRPPMGVIGGGGRAPKEEFILASRQEAELVLERMTDILDNYEVVSVADLNELVGFDSSHTDNKWGWLDLSTVQIRQIREGYLLELPVAEPIG